jgi:hypothetical protein
VEIVLCASQRQFEAARNRLNDDVRFLDTTLFEFRDGPSHKRIDKRFVPPGVYDCDAQRGSVVMSCYGRAFD